MAELGIGTRVWISYRPDSDPLINAATGVLTQGPFDPGFLNQDPRDGFTTLIRVRSWAVKVDTDPTPGDWVVPEERLHPIDDGEEQRDRNKELEKAD